jgi:hypothetical protein
MEMGSPQSDKCAGSLSGGVGLVGQGTRGSGDGENKDTEKAMGLEAEERRLIAVNGGDI